MATEFTVTFGLRAHDLEPLEVTRQLGMDPTRAHREGEPRPGPRFHAPWPHGLWSLDSPLTKPEPLDAHLRWFLERLEPKSDAIRGFLQRGCTADIYIGCFSDCDQFGAGISAELAERLGKLGIDLVINGYAG